MRHDTCITCNSPFTAPHRHPMIEEAWCPSCLVIVRECVIELHLNVGPCAAMRSESI